MNSPLERFKLPDMPTSFSASTSPSRSRIDSSGWQEKTSKSKPTFLARKINSDQLFGDSFKVGLSQISEEKVMETEELEVFLEASQAETENPLKKEPRNIFERESLISSKYKEHGKGPSLTPDGRIVKHSIVGPVETFDRYQRGMKKHVLKDIGTGTSFERDSASEKSFSTRILQHSNSYKGDQTPISQGRLNTGNSIIGGKSSFENKKPKKDLRVSKKEIMAKIDQFRERQRKFYEEEAKKYKHLTKGDRLHLTKEQRCLQEYTKTIDKWDETIESITQRAKRKVGKSVMLRTDEYREKLEIAEAFDMVRTDHERLGSMYWYMNLRNSGLKTDKTLQRVITDIPHGFKCPQMVRPISSLERIRKPNKLSKSAVLLPPIQPPQYLDRTINEYITERSADLESQLSKIMSTGRLENTDEFLVECFYMY